MTSEHELLEDTAEELFEDAPCGFLITRVDGTIVKVNRTFEAWTGLRRDDLLGERRFQDLLSAGGRIYHETHYAPLLQMQESVREIAVDIVRADGSLLPALINSVLRSDESGRERVVRTTVFDATDRRRYEQELLRARRREHDIAQQLQRSLLSGELPVSARVQLAAAYRPAVSGLEVGGDWYDAFWLDDGETLGLVVGDVVGRGIGAAATMGQLRSAVRALASTGLGVGPVLEAVDRFSRRHGVGQMATLVYAQLEIGTGVLRYACAGHPPPLLVMPGGDPIVLWGGRSLPLEAQRSTAARTEDAQQLEPGSILLLYTDGLVERRTQSIDDGMSTLGAELARLRHEDLAVLADSIVQTLRDAEHADDVCLLAARLRK